MAKYDHWTSAEEKLLGTAPDRDVARLIGRTEWAVKARRLKLHLPAISPPRAKRRGGWTSEMDERLGTAPDAEIAEQVGKSVSAVTHRRRRLGIQGWPRGINKALLLKGLRVCSHCGTTKLLSGFYQDAKYDDGYTTWCRECKSSYSARRRQANKKSLVHELGEECQRCGYKETLAGLSFHHVNGREKTHLFHKGDVLSSLGQEKRLVEADKCVLLCRCCHGGFHSGEIDVIFEKRGGLGWTVMKHQI